MQREEKRRKFHDSLLNMLYPPPPASPPQREGNGRPINISLEGFHAAHIPGEDELGLEEKSSSSFSSSGECVPQKLTRAQRKRLRKKKLREAASHRRHIVGPLLPNDNTNVPISDGEHEIIKNEPQGVRQNATAELESGIDNTGEQASSSRNNLKQRRMVKRQSRGKTVQQDFPS